MLDILELSVQLLRALLQLLDLLKCAAYRLSLILVILTVPLP